METVSHRILSVKCSSRLHSSFSDSFCSSSRDGESACDGTRQPRGPPRRHVLTLRQRVRHWPSAGVGRAHVVSERDGDVPTDAEGVLQSNRLFSRHPMHVGEITNVEVNEAAGLRLDSVDCDALHVRARALRDLAVRRADRRRVVTIDRHRRADAEVRVVDRVLRHERRLKEYE
jgi:uncharacterized protein YjiS (DUF1127 family)